MKTSLLTATAAAALISLAGAAFAQTQTKADQVLIYAGQPLDSIGAHATSWGGGTATDHDGDAFTTAGHAVHIETAGLYQGGEITLDNPVSLGNLKANPNRYLQIIFSADKSTKYAAPIAQTGAMPGYGSPYGGPAFGAYGANGAPGSNVDPHYKGLAAAFQIAQAGPPPGFNPYINTSPGMPPYAMGGPMPGGMMPGGPMRPATGDMSSLPALAINQIHIVLIFGDGSEAELLRPVTISEGDDITWLRAGIALSAIPLSGSEAADASLKKIYIGTDTPADLNIGEIRLVNDTTAITADAGKSQTVPAGSNVQFEGTGEGGASALKYEWDFDSTGDFETQAEGVRVSHVFTKTGDYTVTLKVSDVDGIKAPATSTVVIHVNDQGPVGVPGLPGGPPVMPGGFPPGPSGAPYFPGANGAPNFPRNGQ